MGSGHNERCILGALSRLNIVLNTRGSTNNTTTFETLISRFDLSSPRTRGSLITNFTTDIGPSELLGGPAALSSTSIRGVCGEIFGVGR